MKSLRLQSMIVVLACALGLSGCAQKKPVLVAPQQLPPTAPPQPTPTPEPTAESQPAEQPQETQQPAATTDQTAKTAEKTQPKNNHHTAAKKPPAAPASNGTEVARNTTTRKVIPADKPGTSETPPGGQISPGPTSADAAHSQTSTEQLLQSTENNLNSIKRQLSKDEEAMRAQIREFINQSRKATTENDLTRAHNFALKARLLSDELAKTQ